MGSVMKGLGSQVKSDLGDAMEDAAKQFGKNAIKWLGTSGVESVNSAMNTLSGVYSKINARL
jgi:hypothetical protein